MSLQQAGVEPDVTDCAVRGDPLWNARATSRTYLQTETRTLNARVVEFIAKPGKFQLLEDFVRGEVLEFLSGQNGFAGAIIMNSHEERRQILVVSFWTTQRMAAQNCWESSHVVRRSSSSLIDICSRAHTYEAALASSIEFNQENAASRLEWPEVNE
jgi:heme-degrading monooxygenase HmoA